MIDAFKLLKSVFKGKKSPPKVVVDLKVQGRCVELVEEYFKGDKEKTLYWFSTPNPLLGNVTPGWMLAVKPQKLLDWIEAAREGY